MPVTIDEIIDIFERANNDALQEKGGVEGFARDFGTDLKDGLGQSERDSDYAERKEKYGINELPPPPTKSWLRMFGETFEDLMLKILIGCAVLSLILQSVFPDGGVVKFENYIETISIVIAILLVSIVQASINYSQQKSFLEINKLKNVFNINVIRCGEELQILSTELLVGDILSLKNGDRVAADALYIRGHDLKVNNSQETGESCAVQINDSYPFILGGGAVETGDALALVCAVGRNSQSGVTMMKIQEIEEEHSKSPLEKKLDKIAKLLTYIGIAGAALTFVVLLIFWIIDGVQEGFKKEDANVLVRHLMTAITIFICAVPEGLPLAVTISLGFSMKKMMKDNNFVRHLNACETMGGATTICSDKTGTLTQNKMTVVKFYMPDRVQEQNPQMPAEVLQLFTEGIAINTSAYYSVNEGETEGHYIGQSSECALLQMLPLYEIKYKDVREANPIVVLHEFNSERKRMSTIIKKDDHHRIYAKGAPDYVLRLSSHYLDADGQRHELTDEVRQQFLTQIGLFADQSLRTMLLAYNELESAEPLEEWKDPSTVETGLTVIAIVGIADPLRPEVIQAVENCHRAGVTVRMVTGDYINTAKAIARECHILKEGDIAMEGAEFATKSKLELIDIVPKLRVMARSSPRDKYRLVSFLMEAGEVVAVTGDGSNDSAALKKANVGLSMGQCGTELAKMASDIIILDDNFNSIVSALKWGRCVYNNVRGFLQFQLTVNFAAMFIAFIGSVALKESPLTTVQLLWVNLIMDSLGALALATRGPNDKLLDRPPYGESDGLINGILLRNIIGHTVYQIVVLCLFIFAPHIFNLPAPVQHMVPTELMAVLFNSFIFMQVFNLINARVVDHSINPFQDFFGNPFFLIILLAIAAFQVVIIEGIPAAFSVQRLNWLYWVISLAFGLGSIVIGFLLRFIPIPDNTAQKLDALRQLKRQEMQERYQNMTMEEQWNYTPVTETSEEEDKAEP